MKNKPGYTDADRVQFIKKLDSSDKGYPNDWEIEFLESNIDRETFSPAQRSAIDKMIAKYGDIIKW
jgi:hypothetical protein